MNFLGVFLLYNLGQPILVCLTGTMRSKLEAWPLRSCGMNVRGYFVSYGSIYAERNGVALVWAFQGAELLCLVLC